MTQIKYYQRDKCKYCNVVGKQRYSYYSTPVIECMQCNNTDFIRGADVTELMEWLLKDGKITTAYIKNYLKIIEVVEE